MSAVIKALKDSTEPLENDLAVVYEHWQGVKRSKGLRAGLGYEPRDINADGAVSVISSRVLKASSGFEEVDPKLSYEALVLKYPDKFTAEVFEAATERLALGTSKARAFQAQDIQFFIKTSSIELFGEAGVPASVDDWIGRKANIPILLKENDYAEAFLENGFRSIIWLHEKGNQGDKGRGLTALLQFGAMDNKRNALVIDALIFEHPVGNEVLVANKDNSEFIAKVRGYNHTRTWPITDDAVSILLNAAQHKTHLFAQYEKQDPDPSDPLNMEKVEDTSILRQVVTRRNQSAFRQALLKQRPNRCAISATSEVAVLEAAHIIPYSERFADRDKPENGLLLRSDIHKLFDAYLITINPKTRTVEVAESIQSTDYVLLKGKKIGDDLSIISLTHHFEKFSTKLS